jgi:cobalt-zinc-cadmium resistance protein CzcA
MKPLITILACTIIQINILSQNILTLDSAINRALEYYPGIKIAKLNIEKQNTEKAATLNFGNTSIFTGVEEYGNNSNGIYNKLGISQTNIDPLGIITNSKINKIKKQQAANILALTKKRIIKEIKILWVKAVASKKLLTMLTLNDSIFSGFEKAAKLRFETKQTSKIEYLTAVTKYKEYLINLHSFKNTYITLLQNLNKYLMYEKSFDIDTSFSNQLLPPLKNSPLKTNTLLLDYLNSNILLAKENIKAEKYKLLPKINISYKLQEIDGTPGYNAWEIGISAPVIFYSQSKKIKTAKINYEIANIEFIKNTTNINTQYNKLLNKYILAEKNYNFYKKEMLPLANEQLKANLIAYKLGEIDYLHFLQNAENAIKIKNELIQKELNLYITSIELEFFNN